MYTIAINTELFSALGEDGAAEVSRIMRENGLLSEEEIEIVGSDDVPLPDISDEIFGMTFGDALEADSGVQLKFLKVPSWICKAACDAAAAAAAAALTLSGPALAAALAAIAIAREECRRRC